MTTPVLYLLVGPDGAGKTTFFERLLEPVSGLPFVNADRIAAERWPGDELAHAYDAAAAAGQLREAYLAAGTSFVAETVFSHPGKVNLVADARRRAYVVSLRVIVVPVELSVARVANRVAHGGHDVPVAKVRARHQQLWPLVRTAIDLAHDTVVYDNSDAVDPFRPILTYRSGHRLSSALRRRGCPTR